MEPTLLSSAHNPVARKFREAASGRSPEFILLEGRHLLEEALAVRWPLGMVLLEKGLWGDWRDRLVSLASDSRVYLAPRVLIIDEFGVWPYDRLAATALFSLISSRYERGSIILTSNKGFGEWGDVLGDSVVATAILDRLLHHSHVLNIRGESYRLREKKRAGLFGTHKADEAKEH